MAHAQRPDLVFQVKRTSPFKSAGGWRHFSRLLAAEVCVISGSNAGYTMFRGSVKGTGYPLHSTVSPSLPYPCVTVCHHILTGIYNTSGIRNAKTWLLGGPEFVTRKINKTYYNSVSQPPGRGPVPGPGINYTGPREVLLKFVTLVF